MASEPKEVLEVKDGEILVDNQGEKQATFKLGISQKYALINKLITRDLNQRKTTQTAFTVFSKDDINRFIANPALNEKELRKAVRYIYSASPHFRRLIQYFTGLSDLAYYISPYNIDPRTANARTTNINYRKVLKVLNSMNIKTQFPKILKVCLREDVFYGTLRITDKSIIVQQLPSDYCQIQSIEDNVFNVTFDFSYFDRNLALLDFYPEEFRLKYETYRKFLTARNKDAIKIGDILVTGKWIELDAPNSFAIKFDGDILDYALPPFASLLREVYDIEDYKQLKLSKTALENYAMLAMTLPMDDEGHFLIDSKKAEDFWSNLDAVMPEEVGSVLTPMKIDKISFERSHADDSNTVADAENSLFTSAGVSSLLFNNEKASSNALLLSIKADQALTFSIVKSIEDMLNRFIQRQSYGKYFKVTFLDVSPFNRKEMGDQYLKAAQFGLPTVSMYAASQGLSQSEFDLMNYLENDILMYHDILKPLKSSSTLSAEDAKSENGTAGRPQLGVGEINDGGEQAKEVSDNNVM